MKRDFSRLTVSDAVIADVGDVADHRSASQLSALAALIPAGPGLALA